MSLGSKSALWYLRHVFSKTSIGSLCKHRGFEAGEQDKSYEEKVRCIKYAFKES